MGAVSRLAKLRAMPPREVLSRGAYKAYLMCERALHRRDLLARPDRLRGALVGELRHAANWQQALLARQPQARFFTGFDSADRVRAMFDDRFSAERVKARQIADDVAAQRIAFFGEQFAFGSDIDWHADPVTGARWPRSFHGDMSVHTGNVGFGDVKHVWEINRHQFFIDLAKIAFLDRSSAHAAVLHRHLRHWMAEVPYATGAAWACALEPAFRAWSWMWAYHFVRAANLLDDDTQLQWLTGFHDHGRFLYRHLETYSSPYNHLIGEASALFALGLLFPEFREAPAWVARGRHVLETSLAAQFHADGGTVEQSTFYHHATLGFYLLAAVLGRRNGVELSDNVWAAVERGVQFSTALMQPDGRVPRFGGADDGKPIRLEHLPFWDFRPYQALGAVLFSRPDFRFVAGRFWEDALWILGPDGATEFDRLGAHEPAKDAALSVSGYYVTRNNWSAQADYLCFDCGEQAGGLRRDDVPSAAHGHADCLSVVVALGGREVLVDPGFFCYNGDPEWEVHFRKTAAHNTVTVDGCDQAHHVSKMAWTRTYRPALEWWSATHQLGCVIGSHDGYVHNGQGVEHRRTAWLRADGYVVIRDELTGTPGRRIEANFQFAPGSLVANGASATFENRYQLAWACSAPVHSRVFCGGDSPSDGWIATSLGVRRPAPRLSLQFVMNEERVVLLTIVTDRLKTSARGAAQVSAASRVGDRLLRLNVAGDGWVDDVVAARVGDASVDDVQTDAPLVVVRRISGRATEALHVGGTYARATGLSAFPGGREHNGNETVLVSAHAPAMEGLVGRAAR